MVSRDTAKIRNTVKINLIFALSDQPAQNGIVTDRLFVSDRLCRSFVIVATGQLCDIKL